MVAVLGDRTVAISDQDLLQSCAGTHRKAPVDADKTIIPRGQVEFRARGHLATKR